jgi:hypothetical protein
VPDGYKLVIEQDFADPASLDQFVFTDKAAWKHVPGSPAGLELVTQSQYTPPFRSPFNIALINGVAFGDFILEARCLQTGKEYGHRDMVFVYGWQSPCQFYYTHVATKADAHAHNCFIVNNAARVKFGSEVTAGAKWGLNEWHTVRIHRKASDGTVLVYFDNLEKPIMRGTNTVFGKGHIGFGSFDDTGKIAALRVWAKDVEQRQIEPFKSVSAPGSK